LNEALIDKSLAEHLEQLKAEEDEDEDGDCTEDCPK
jgi:hypothetical protein